MTEMVQAKWCGRGQQSNRPPVQTNRYGAVELTLGTSATPMPPTHVATSAMPALPGRQKSSPSMGDCFSFQQSACSSKITARQGGVRRYFGAVWEIPQLPEQR